MRIAIDLRLLFAHHNLRTRGTVRYTLQLVREVLRVDAENAYLLITPEDAAHDVLPPEVQHAPSVEIAPCPAGFVPDYECSSPTTVARQTDALEAWLAGQRIDVFHATIPLIFHKHHVVGTYNEAAQSSTCRSRSLGVQSQSEVGRIE